MIIKSYRLLLAAEDPSIKTPLAAMVKEPMSLQLRQSPAFNGITFRTACWKGDSASSGVFVTDSSGLVFFCKLRFYIWHSSANQLD